MGSLHSLKAVCAKGLGFAALTLLVPSTQANTFNPDSAQDPLFLTAPVRPLMMLNMSNDHQLFFKLYDDYTDLDGDGVADTTYNHEYEEKYYGYFDSEKCYQYDNGRFEPDTPVDGEGYCNAGENSNQWSGNFLNWATMTRIDAVRKILYGGFRSTDTDELTVLERSLIPHDAHSFAKYYNRSDIGRLTPFDDVTGGSDDSQTSGITICNTTDGSGYSQTVTNPPLMRVAEGNYSLWASNERWQCRWNVASNDNDPSITGINASSDSPDNTGSDSVALGQGDFNVRVVVCEDGNTEGNCTRYPNDNYKPTGLLQRYGEDGSILFGLMTGSYGKNKSGGVLRKNIGNLRDEINVSTDGTYKTAPSAGNIIDTLNKLRIYGYNYGDGLYDGDGNSDDCPFGLTGFDDGTCSNWGNPQSEIFLESLRYFAGGEVNADFLADDDDYIDGLISATWVDPIDSDNYCAPLNVIQFNASTSSYDGDVPGLSDIGLNSVADWVNDIGEAEGIHSSLRFVGTTSTDDDELCTPKLIANLSEVTGTCPDAPRLEGTYNIAGLAYYARKNRIRETPAKTKTVKTYGVALAAATPSVTVPVPEGSGDVINILPACKNQQTSGGESEGNCAIVDFKIVEQTFSSSLNEGKLYINWEAAEQGGDYDSDMWGILEYSITPSEVTITTEVIQQSSGRPLGFGYVISGTSDDGFKVHSGINNFTYGDSCTANVTGQHSSCSCRFSGSTG